MLLLSGAVSNTAPKAHNGDAINDSQVLQALQALEQQAAKEAQIIQALNERIRQLELKVAAINSIVIEQRAPKQVNLEPIQSEKTKSAPHDSPQIFGGSAIIHNDSLVSDNHFIIEDLFDFISTPHLVPATAGILTILLLMLVFRIYKRKRSNQLLSSDDKAGVRAIAKNPNPLRTNEKNALVAQKLAALRTAVEKGKQRRHQKE
ncbi:MAG: hypothetical protein MRK00_14975 [Nitrosomonas sp.]|nr:hypothetical protein [Nitrosomonas sp.]